MACIGTLRCGYSPPIIRHLVCIFFIKILVVMSISTNIQAHTKLHDYELILMLKTSHYHACCHEFVYFKNIMSFYVSCHFYIIS